VIRIVDLEGKRKSKQLQTAKICQGYKLLIILKHKQVLERIDNHRESDGKEVMKSTAKESNYSLTNRMIQISDCLCLATDNVLILQNGAPSDATGLNHRACGSIIFSIYLTYSCSLTYTFSLSPSLSHSRTPSNAKRYSTGATHVTVLFWLFMDFALSLSLSPSLLALFSWTFLSSIFLFDKLVTKKVLFPFLFSLSHFSFILLKQNS